MHVFHILREKKGKRDEKGGEGVRLFALKSVKLRLILFSIMHLVTDGLCAFIVFSRLYPDNPEQSFYVFVGYNLLAFVT